MKREKENNNQKEFEDDKIKSKNYKRETLTPEKGKRNGLNDQYYGQHMKSIRKDYVDKQDSQRQEERVCYDILD